METLELEELPEVWNRSLAYCYGILKEAIKLEEGKEIVDKVERNKVLIKSLEDAMVGSDTIFLLEDYEHYINTGEVEHIFVTSHEKWNEYCIRRADKEIEEAIKRGEI